MYAAAETLVTGDQRPATPDNRSAPVSPIKYFITATSRRVLSDLIFRTVIE